MSPITRKNRSGSETLSRIKNLVLRITNDVLFYLSLIASCTIIYDFGFQHSQRIEEALNSFHSFTLTILFVAIILRAVLSLARRKHHKPYLSEYLILLLLFLGFWNRMFFSEQGASWFDFFESSLFTSLVILAIFFIELSRKSLSLYSLKFNPALLFLISFIVLIFLGAGLLLLPRATVNGISVVDAFFTSTSAVCVTGLTVLDTATQFTYFGKLVILCLIQVGGLGVMTFTSFFGIFFQEGASFQNQLFMKDLINEERIGDTFRTLVKVIVFTFIFEGLGAAFIYFSLPPGLMGSMQDQIEFSVFHAVSAFCNAGFSLLTNNLYELGYRYNYNLHLIIAGLIILGGIGYPVMLNIYRYAKHHSKRRGVKLFFSHEEFVHIPRIISVNTKIVLATTVILLALGTVLYFMLEYNNTLAAHNWYGKLVTAFFSAVTPRTAGFNTVDMSQLAAPTVLVFLLLMWIGAAPGSTGGGIKISTFAVAWLNAISIGKEHDRLELFRRQIDSESVRRAFAVMLLSFLVIGMAVFLVTILDPEKQLIAVAFECFSAFGTVGLSLGITSTLSSPAKVVILFAMFIGRVGTLTILVAFIRKVHTMRYRYPSETIIIT